MASDLDVWAGETDTHVNLVVGQALRLHLPASPATGHVWELEGIVPSLLDMEADPGFEPLMASRMLRGGGIQTWRLRAVRPGRIMLNFVYRRSWDAGTGPARRARFVVNVRPGAD